MPLQNLMTFIKEKCDLTPIALRTAKAGALGYTMHVTGEDSVSLPIHALISLVPLSGKCI